MSTKYRNGLTNIGIYCGFARDLGEGRIRVQQKSWGKMGVTFVLDEGVRGPTQDFEPVTVIFQAVPGRNGAMPEYVALYVTRMARTHWPKRFNWRSGAWPNDRDFYPFQPDQPGAISDEMNALLADQHTFPEWLLREAAQDPLLTDLLEKRHSNGKLPSRLILTGKMESEAICSAVDRDGNPYTYIKTRLRQPGDDPASYFPIDVTYRPGFGLLARRKYPVGGLPVTVVLAVASRIEDWVGEEASKLEGAQQPRAVEEFHIADLLSVADIDLAPDMNARLLLGDAR